MLERMPNVGEYVRYLGGEGAYSHSGLEIGGVYEVVDSDDISVDIRTDNGGGWVIFDSDFAKYELVEPETDVAKELTVQLSVDAEVVRLLAKMALKITELELRVKDLETERADD